MLGMRSVRAHGSAALALSNLRLNDENKIKIMANMPALNALLLSPSPRTQEHAAGSLRNIGVKF
jgi:hypothetical protein